MKLGAEFVPAGVTCVVAKVPPSNVWKFCCVMAEPVNVGAATLPAGVKLTVEFVPAGVPALTAEVAWLAVPVKAGELTVPDGV